MWRWFSSLFSWGQWRPWTSLWPFLLPCSMCPCTRSWLLRAAGELAIYWLFLYSDLFWEFNFWASSVRVDVGLLTESFLDKSKSFEFSYLFPIRNIKVTACSKVLEAFLNICQRAEDKKRNTYNPLNQSYPSSIFIYFELKCLMYWVDMQLTNGWRNENLIGRGGWGGGGGGWGQAGKQVPVRWKLRWVSLFYFC